MRELVRVFHSWWRTDRIRVSRDEGRLLRLDPGAVIALEGCRLLITRRTTDRRDGHRVLYDCRGETEDSTLEVALDAAGNRPSITWNEDFRRRDVAPAEIEIIGGG